MLLGGLGLFCGPDHNTGFYRYFLYLRDQQNRHFPTQPVVPESYLLFRFARPHAAWAERWRCPNCQNGHYYQQVVSGSVCRCGAPRVRDEAYVPMPRGWEYWPSSYLKEFLA